MRLSVIDGEVRAQVSSKHKPGSTDSTSLEKSAGVSVSTHFTV